MTTLAILLSRVWPFRIIFEKRSSSLTLDETTFPECESKEVKVWSWRSFKTVKYLVHYNQGEFVVTRLA